MSKPTIFISYSHKDEIWKDHFKPHLSVLEKAGEVVVWDDRLLDGGDQWYDEIEAAMSNAAVAVCLISQHYLSSAFCVGEETPFLLKRSKQDGMLLIPILISPCLWEVYRWLKDTQMFPRDGKSVAIDYPQTDGAVVFSKVAELIYKKINDTNYVLPTPAIKWQPPKQIYIERLPVTGKELFGRDKELDLLDQAWASDTTNIVSFIAWGGVGKSTLINKWLEGMAKDNYQGAVNVFGWSFYSQGSSEQATSADVFIDHALKWFGDTTPQTSQAGSAWSKGQRLAELVQQHKTLLILDGLEPLQSAHEFEKGKIKDPALTMLLRTLAIKNNGLCVITSRESIPDIAKFEHKTESVNLETLSKEAGRALLRVGGVNGTDKALEEATESFGAHALAINLLTTYLKSIKGHPISAALQIPDLPVLIEKGKHPRRVIDALSQRFVDQSEGELLTLLGFFDRPADIAAIRQIIAPPSIKGLTDNLCEKDEAVLLLAINRLRSENLLAEESTHNPGTLDCHPLIREHFADKLETDNPTAWQAANGRLYAYYKNLPEKELPDTLAEMEPLFAAIRHGCLAGLHQEVMDNVYYKKVYREGDFYIVNQLGAFGADLSCLAHFFASLWDKPAANLTADDQAVVLSWAGFALRATGRLFEATEPMKAGLAMRVKDKLWKNAAIAASNLSQLYLTLGEVALAEDYGEQSVIFADRSEEDNHMESKRTTHADALHQAGKSEFAEQRFIEAETRQKDRLSDDPWLFSLPGFHFCDLLLSMKKYSEVLTRAKQTITYPWCRPLDKALDTLTIGKTLMLQSIDNKTADFSQASDYLHQAVEGLRESGAQEFIPRGLLTRATLYRQQKNWPQAWRDLDETLEIAEFGQMQLHLTDYHLEACRTLLAQIEADDFTISEKGETLNLTKAEMQGKFKTHLMYATALVKKTGYHRRDDEIAQLQLVSL